MDDAPTAPGWQEIITQLRLEAGRVMEDRSVELASVLPFDPAASAMQLRQDCAAAADIGALLAAAEVLHRRCLTIG